jgi:hypothetical protein
MAGNPLESVGRADSDRDGNDKAALTAEQAEALLDATTRHRLLYLVAIRTGLRRGELRKLQWGDLQLDGERPHVKLRASATKARRADTLPLREDAAEALREARPADAKPMDRVFLSMPKMWTFRADLDRAGIPHYDERGRKMCFHSLRVTFGTWLAQAGTAPRVHMELLRHTDLKLTMTYYTDPRLLDTARAVADLPDLGGPAAMATMRATGTENAQAAQDAPRCPRIGSLAQARPTGPTGEPPRLVNDSASPQPARVLAKNTIAQKYVSECPSLSTSGQNGGASMQKTPVKQGFSLEAV